MPESRPPRPTVRRLYGFLRTQRWPYLGGLLGYALLTTGERVFIAYVLKMFTDALLAGNLTQLSSIVALSVVFYAALVLVLPFLLTLWRGSISRVMASLRQSLYDHLGRLPLEYYERRHSGDVMSVLTNDVAALEQAYRDDLLTLVQSLLQGLTAAVLMFTLQWELALVIVVCGLVPLAANALFAPPLRRIGEETQARLGTLSERLSDLLAGFQVIRAFSLGEWILARFAQANGEVLDSTLRRVRLEARLAVANHLGSLLWGVAFAFGGYLVLQGRTTFGVFLALTQLNNQVQYLAYALGGTITRLQGALAATDRVLDLLDVPPEPERCATGQMPAAATPTAGDALLQFCDVTFGYEGEQEVLRGLSFAVPRGQVAALVGPSGAGKSTILKLLLGCYPLRSGAILVAGRSIGDYTLAALRDLFAYVPQEAYLYSGTILENIRYGKPDAADDQVLAAARGAHAHEFIMELPDGYSTAVGERGAKLSGGQRQRVAIARALLKDAPILLLDEATSALDSESERLVQEALQVLMRGRTTVAIAHRLSTIESADVIHVLDGGRVLESGQHGELMAHGGLYSMLHTLQFKS